MKVVNCYTIDLMELRDLGLGLENCSIIDGGNILNLNFQVLYDIFRNDMRLWNAYSATLQVKKYAKFITQ